MLYLVQTFAIPLAAALIGGLAVGWVTSDKEDQGPSRWAALAITAFALMAVAAALKWLPGRPGFWLDTALLFSTVYLGGCIVGAFARVFTNKVDEMTTEPLTQAMEAGQAFASGLEPAKAAASAAANAARAMSVPAPAQAPAEAPAEVPAAPAVTPAPQPLTGAAAAAEAMAQGTKPQGLETARNNRPDDLKLIKGIGPQNEARLHALGVWHFDQIAQWVQKEAQWVGGYLAFPGRIEREDWIAQAKALAEGKLTEFAERVQRGEVPTSRDDDPDHDDPNADVGHLNESARPQGLVGPRAGGADDLSLIRGVGPQIQGKLYEMGIWHFDQIGSLSEAELNYVSAFVGAPGRAARDNWSGESRILAAGGDTEHSKAVKAGRR